MRLLSALAVFGLTLARVAQAQSLLNVSYDPTRELYAAINPAFAALWKQQSGRP